MEAKPGIMLVFMGLKERPKEVPFMPRKQLNNEELQCTAE
jgi:hypothetical protein